MSFVHPQIAAATLGLALLPIIIHLLNRRRFRREPWAAMQFLLAEHERTRRRIRIEQWLLMFARVVVVLLVGMTIARPYLPASATSPVALRPVHDHVLIVDDSASMHVRHADGATAFEKAQKAALRLLASAKSGDRFAVVTTSPPHGDWFQTPTRDVERVRIVLESLACSHDRDDLPAALRKSSDILHRGGALEGCRIAHLFSDLAAHAVPIRDAATADAAILPAIDRLIAFDAGPPDRDNIAIVDVRTEGALLGPGVPVPVQVEIANFGKRPSSDLSLELLLGDRAVASVKSGELAAGARHTMRVDVLPAQAGPQPITARLAGKHADALALDDQRRLALVIPQQTSVLLVEGSTHTDRTRQAVFYVKSALASISERDDRSHMRSIVIPAADLVAQPLDDYAIVALAGVSRLPPDAWARLSEFVERGGGLMAWLDESAQADSYNEGWLAKHMRIGGRACVLDSFRRIDDGTDPMPLSVADARNPILREFAGAEGGGLHNAWVRGCWTLRETGPLPNAEESSTVLLRTADGSPVLLAGRQGHGAFVLGLAGPDMSHWNLPAKPDYVPLIWSIASWCAPDVNLMRTRLVGEVLRERLAGRAAAQSVSLITPAGIRQELVPQLEGPVVCARFAGTSQPGFFRLFVGGEERVAAINQDSAESDTARAAAEWVRNLVPGRTSLAGAAEAPVTAAATWEFSTLGMFALVVVVLLETVLATSLGSRT